MKKEDVIIAGLSGEFKDKARSLVESTLTRIAPAIDIVALKVDYVETSSLPPIGYRCTILVKSDNAPVIRARAQDCDEILAVYRATAALLDQLPDMETGASPNRATARISHRLVSRPTLRGNE